MPLVRFGWNIQASRILDHLCKFTILLFLKKKKILKLLPNLAKKIKILILTCDAHILVLPCLPATVSVSLVTSTSLGQS